MIAEFETVRAPTLVAAVHYGPTGMFAPRRGPPDHILREAKCLVVQEATSA